MIPKNIRRENIVKAIGEVERVGIPNGRSSKKFLLEYNGKYYPPKYIISLANRYTNGKELEPSEFSGGKETNDILRDLGFNIVESPFPEKPVLKSFKKNAEMQYSKTQHYERCPKCEETIRKLLEKIYGKVEVEHKFKVGTHPENFKDKPYYNNLKKIYQVLQNHRGHKEFVKVKTLPACDYFIPNPGFIVELDESQHFTFPRKIALEHYPEKLELGFDRKRWVELCEKINAKDNDPPDRDEKRAWYETLRDFLPLIRGLQPTIRLYRRYFVWCSLNPEDKNDLNKFKNYLEVNI